MSSLKDTFDNHPFFVLLVVFMLGASAAYAVTKVVSMEPKDVEIAQIKGKLADAEKNVESKSKEIESMKADMERFKSSIPPPGPGPSPTATVGNGGGGSGVTQLHQNFYFNWDKRTPSITPKSQKPPQLPKKKVVQINKNKKQATLQYSGDSTYTIIAKQGNRTLELAKIECNTPPLVLTDQIDKYGYYTIEALMTKGNIAYVRRYKWDGNKYFPTNECFERACDVTNSKQVTCTDTKIVCDSWRK